MSTPRTALAALAAATLATLGCAALVTQAQAPTPAPVAFEPQPVADGSYLVVPARSKVSTQTLLERRLAALAADVEARGSTGHAAGLVEFDVERLSEEIGAVVSRIEERAQVSVHVRDLSTQHVLFDYFGDTPLNPASNHKLLTTSAALDLLGPDHTFETRVAIAGRDLHIVGEGDPTLQVEDLHALADAVLDGVSITDVDRMVVDDTAFSPRRHGPGYSDAGPGAAHEAPSGALSLAFNTVEVTVYPMARGREVGVVVTPESDHVVVRSSARVGARTRLSVYTEPAGDETAVVVTGTLARGARPYVVRRRVSDPGRFTAATLTRILAERTQTAPLEVGRGPLPAHAEELATHASAPLAEIVDSGLAYSNNFMAEQLLRTLAWKMTGNPGDWQHGREVLLGYWSALGNDPEELAFENASGFSRVGRVTTSGLVDLISMAHRVQDDRGLISALPVAGEPGTLRTRLRLSGKRVRAKTGTLAGVSGLSGVLTGEDGSAEIAFSILTNVRDAQTMNASARRRAEDEIVMEVLRSLDEFHARRAGIGAGRSG